MALQLSFLVLPLWNPTSVLLIGRTMNSGSSSRSSTWKEFVEQAVQAPAMHETLYRPAHLRYHIIPCPSKPHLNLGSFHIFHITSGHSIYSISDPRDPSIMARIWNHMDKSNFGEACW
jgi:hypothetical protein